MSVASLDITLLWPHSTSHPAATAKGDWSQSEGEANDPEAAAETEIAAQVWRDPECFEQLYERYYERIVQYLYRRVGNADTAYDLASTVFLKAFDSLRLRPQRVHVRPWLYRIATNVLISHIRSSKSALARFLGVAARLVSQSAPEPCELAEAHQRRRLVRRELALLPDKYRLALLLRFDEELPYEEIAQVLGITTAGARSRVSRAVAMLEARLQHLEGERP